FAVPDPHLLSSQSGCRTLHIGHPAGLDLDRRNPCPYSGRGARLHGPSWGRSDCGNRLLHRLDGLSPTRGGSRTCSPKPSRIGPTTSARISYNSAHAARPIAVRLLIRHVRDGSFSTEPASPTCQFMSASPRRRPEAGHSRQKRV